MLLVVLEVVNGRRGSRGFINSERSHGWVTTVMGGEWGRGGKWEREREMVAERAEVRGRGDIYTVGGIGTASTSVTAWKTALSPKRPAREPREDPIPSQSLRW